MFGPKFCMFFWRQDLCSRSLWPGYVPLEQRFNKRCSFPTGGNLPWVRTDGCGWEALQLVNHQQRHQRSGSHHLQVRPKIWGNFIQEINLLLNLLFIATDISLRFFLGTTPAPVRSLHVVRGATRREPADGNVVTPLGTCHNVLHTCRSQGKRAALGVGPPDEWWWFASSWVPQRVKVSL
jgi:hypothetical protein